MFLYVSLEVTFLLGDGVMGHVSLLSSVELSSSQGEFPF